MLRRVARMIALIMEAVRSSETSVNIYQNTRRTIPEDSNLQFLFNIAIKNMSVVRDVNILRGFVLCSCLLLLLPKHTDDTNKTT
jgi:hypothetical protein